jgi:hypothetical protein
MNSAPMSFVGSTARIWRLTRASTQAWARVLLGSLAVLLLPVAWVGVLAWYAVVFGLFGLFAIPFRLIRRGQRKQLHATQQR